MPNLLFVSRRTAGSSAAAVAFALCTACTAVPASPSSPRAVAGTATSSAAPAGTGSREISLGGAVQGALAANGDADDYQVRVSRGQAFNAVLDVPNQGDVTLLQVQVFRQNPVTSELESLEVALNRSTDGAPAATGPISVGQEGLYVVRVEGADTRFGGRYALRVLPSAKGTIALGQPREGVLDGRGDTDDYEFAAAARSRFNARLAVPYTGTPTTLSVTVLRRDSVTGDLQPETSTMVESRLGQPGATQPVDARQGGAFIIRVAGADARMAGRYVLTVDRP